MSKGSSASTFSSSPRIHGGMAASPIHRKLVLSASIQAIRRASCPNEALTLLNLRLRGVSPPDPYTPHAAVFTLKAVSSSSPSLRRALTPLLHGYVIKSGVFSEVHVASALLHAYSLASFGNARNVFDEMPRRNLVTTNIMISCYTRNGDVRSARLLFDSSFDKDIVSWSLVIKGYMEKNRTADGLLLFRKMMLQGELKPDGALLVILLSGCVGDGCMTLLCKSIHGYALKNVLEKEMNQELGTSLITMYAKAGNLKCALSAFNQIPKKNTVHWTAMICGLAMHGHENRAISLLQKMRKSGVKPNEITFTAIFNACCHAGFTDQAQKFLTLMVQELRFKPRLHHYGCLVNLYAKAGRLDEAYAIIKCMDILPNIVIWTSFLEACRKYKKFEMALEGIEKVLGMATPDQNGGVYTLVSDLYALGGRWHDAEQIRQLMEQQKVVKIAGLSSVEVDKKEDNLFAE